MVKLIQVLIIEDCPLTRCGIEHILSETDGIEVMDKTTTWLSIKSMIHSCQPDVLCVSLDSLSLPLMPVLADFHCSYPNVRILLLGDHYDGICIQRIMKVGVRGVILKPESIEVIVTAIQAVATGGCYFSPSVFVTLSCPISPIVPLKKLKTLTARDRQIFDLVVSGLDTAQVAVNLNLAQQTIRNRLSIIYQKIGVQSLSELIVWAWRHGVAKK